MMIKTMIPLSLCLMAVLMFISPVLHAAPLNAGQMKKYLKNQTSTIVYGEKMLDSGQTQQASQLLKQAVKQYPGNDVINALYGQALYESKAMDQSEEYFMKALRLNAGNIRAQKYITQIRNVRNSTISEDAQEWATVIKDKIGDLVVFVLSIWLGTSINSFYLMMMKLHHWRRAKKKYIEKRYMEVVRILESYVADINQDQDAIDQGLHFMLDHSANKNNVCDILKRFVIREEDLKILLRSLDLLTDNTGNDAA